MKFSFVAFYLLCGFGVWSKEVGWHERCNKPLDGWAVMVVVPLWPIGVIVHSYDGGACK